MSHSYYYFAASLPMLDFEGKLPLTVEQYLDECDRLLQEDDAEAIQNALSSSFQECSFGNTTFKIIQDFYRRFNNAKVVFRAGKLHKDANDFIKGEPSFDPQLIEVVKQASKQDNLFVAEKMLDRACWDYLDELVVGHYFDMDFLLVYGLKLKILERYETLNTTKGQEIYNQYKVMDFSKIEIVQV